MGQRTQIFLQRINKDGQIKNEFYHYQWGYGARMYRELMKLFLGMIDNHDGVDFFDKDNYDFFKRGKLYGYNDTEYFEDIEDITDIESEEFIQTLQSEGDNNNGYLVIRMIEDNYLYETPHFAFGFVDCGRYGDYEFEVTNRYLTWQEYAEKHGYDYTDQNFRNMFKYFLEWSQIEELQVKESKDIQTDLANAYAKYLIEEEFERNKIFEEIVKENINNQCFSMLTTTVGKNENWEIHMIYNVVSETWETTFAGKKFSIRTIENFKHKDFIDSFSDWNSNFSDLLDDRLLDDENLQELENMFESGTPNEVQLKEFMSNLNQDIMYEIL